MIHTLVGDELFYQGADLYFERFDGMAVTTDDFVACMEEVSGIDFTQFKRWYTQAGTPLVKVEERYDAEQNQYCLTFKQSLKPTPGQPEKLPMVIPVKMALLTDNGTEYAIDCDGDFNAATGVLTLKEAETTVTFNSIAAKPVASLFRDFSAPVRVDFSTAERDLFILATKDSNTYNRFDAAQKIYLDALLSMIHSGSAQVPSMVTEIVQATLDDDGLSHAIKAALLSLPSYQMLVDNLQENVDAESIINARDAMRSYIAVQFQDRWKDLVSALASAEPYEFNAREAGRRELQGLALSYFSLTGDNSALSSAEALYRAAHNQTDRLNGLKAVVNSTDRNRATSLLNHFYDGWCDDTQMVETWFSMQSGCEGVTVQTIATLMQHEAFDITNPNKVRSVLGGFIANFKAFHNNSGDSYDFVAEKICELDALNPLMAARFVVALENWKVFSGKRGALMKSALEKILNSGQRSPDVLEKVQKALA
jgi:aminopeptidase N